MHFFSHYQLNGQTSSRTNVLLYLQLIHFPRTLLPCRCSYYLKFHNTFTTLCNCFAGGAALTRISCFIFCGCPKSHPEPQPKTSPKPPATPPPLTHPLGLFTLAIFNAPTACHLFQLSAPFFHHLSSVYLAGLFAFVSVAGSSIFM